MAVFIELVTADTDNDWLRRAVGSGMVSGDGHLKYRAGKSIVRRPTRGIEIKDDTYAVIKVVDESGQEVRLYDSSSLDGLSTFGTTNFMLQSVQETRLEKHQILETFGDNYIFFFGEDPRFIEVSALLINTNDFNWNAEWWTNYNEYLRGSKLTERGARIYLFYDDNIVEGYLLGASGMTNGAQPYSVAVQFKMFVTNHANISWVSPPNNTNYPIRLGAPIDVGTLTSVTGGADLVNRYQGLAAQGAAAENAANFSNAVADAVHRGVPSATSLSSALRSAPASFALSTDAWNDLMNVGGNNATGDSILNRSKLFNLVMRQGNPIRGRIIDNIDEFVGAWEYQNNISPGGLVDGSDTGGAYPSAMTRLFRTDRETENLFKDSIQYLSCYGADIDNAQFLINLGLGPNFLQGRNGSTTSYGPPTTSSWVLDPVGSLLNEANRALGNSGSVSSSLRDPLGAVYGYAGFSGPFGTDQATPRDPRYSYPTDFAPGAGYAQAGFGQLGGLGFGSALGSAGDPGYKDPSKFTYAGVSDQRDAFDRFRNQRKDNSTFSLGAGVGVGTSGLTGGASISVPGLPSAFALVAVPGTLDANGLARMGQEAIAAKLAQNKFGFANSDPFGVNCPGSSSSTSYSDNFSYTFP